MKFACSLLGCKFCIKTFHPVAAELSVCGVYTILLSPHQILVCMRILLSINWENMFSVQLVCICRPMYTYDCLFWPNDLLYSPTKHMSAVTFTWGVKNAFIVFYIHISLSCTYFCLINYIRIPVACICIVCTLAWFLSKSSWAVVFKLLLSYPEWSHSGSDLWCRLLPNEYLALAVPVPMERCKLHCCNTRWAK
jgi:hypothetical protein